MANLMMHRDVLKRYYKLPTKVQKRVAEFIERFQADPTDPSLHFHKLEQTMVDPKVRGANLPDGYRAIIITPEKGDTYLMVYIDSHDKAYAWAKLLARKCLKCYSCFIFRGKGKYSETHSYQRKPFQPR